MAKTLKRIKKELVSDKVKRQVLVKLGYLDKVKDGGWDSLNSKECGLVGGMISRERRKKSPVH